MVTVLVAGVGLALAAAERPPRAVLPPPTVVPSATASPLPTPVPAGPTAGYGVSVADDPATHSVVLFGGVDTPDTTWLWDGRRWSSVTPAHSPQARYGAAVAYDPATRLLMLYGGQGDDVGATQFNDTWAWNGVTWARLDGGGTSGPFPGDDGAMAWDAARDEMVLTTSAGSLTNVETWTWNRTRWERDLAGNLTAVAYGATLAYDPESRDVLLVAAAATNFEETSTFDWDGSAWHSAHNERTFSGWCLAGRGGEWAGWVRVSDVLAVLRTAGELLGMGYVDVVPASGSGPVQVGDANVSRCSRRQR